MEVGVCFLRTGKEGHGKASVPRSPTQSCQVSIWQFEPSPAADQLGVFFSVFIFDCSSSSLQEGFLQLPANQGLLSSCMCRLLIKVASFVAEHGCVAFSSFGSLAQLLRGMWGLPGPGMKSTSPALTGRFLTTKPQGKSPCVSYTTFPSLILFLFENGDNSFLIGVI